MSKLLTIILPLLLTVNSSHSCEIFRKCIFALTVSKNVSLANIAACLGKTLADTGIRYMERFLSRFRIEWYAIGRAVIPLLPKSQKYTISMDRTAWEIGKRVYNILTIGINFNGICLPVAAIDIDRDGASNFTQMISVTETLISFIPIDRIELLCADREFCSLNYLRWLKYRGIRFCIRLQARLQIKRKGKAVMLENYLKKLSVGQEMVLKNCQLSLGEPVFKVYIWAYRLRPVTQSDNGLLILATPIKYTETKEAYRLRWYIETTFRCLKSSGFDLEKTHIRDKDRLMTLLKVVCFTFTENSLEGLETTSKQPIRVQLSTGRRRETIFERGRILLIATLLRPSIQALEHMPNVKISPDLSP